MMASTTATTAITAQPMRRVAGLSYQGWQATAVLIETGHQGRFERRGGRRMVAKGQGRRQARAADAGCIAASVKFLARLVAHHAPHEPQPPEAQRHVADPDR